MKYNYILLSDSTPDSLAESVRLRQEEGYIMHGELATCPWPDESIQGERVPSHYCMLYQWMRRPRNWIKNE